MKIQQTIESIILALLVLVIYLFTINPLTKQYAIYALLASFIFLSFLYLVSLKKHHHMDWRINTKTLRILIFVFTTAILLWVGNTGWSLSPFFYLLYILGLALGFLFSTSAAFSFVIVLVAVLLPQIGTINAHFDYVTVLSLFLIVPLSYFLSHAFLKVKEKEKKILILEHEKKNFQDAVEEVLNNKVIKFAADLREPVNDVKQLALYVPKKQTERLLAENRKKIIASSEKALALITKFEEETTGQKFLKTPKRNK